MQVSKKNTDINITDIVTKLLKGVGALEPIFVYLLNLDFDGEMCLNRRVKSQVINYIFGYQEDKSMSSLAYAMLNFIWYSA